MLHHIQDSKSKPEAGGVLLGRRILDTSDVIIDEVTSPTPEDRRTFFSFFRSRKPHQRRIDQAWHESNGTSNYLGEWHTHPEDSPAPSQRDRRSWRKALKETIFEGDELFFVIVGSTSLCVWEGAKFSRKIVRLAKLDQ